MATCLSKRNFEADCFDDVPEFQLSRQIQELRRLSLTTKNSKDKKQFPMHCQECGIEHSSLVGRMDPDDGKWYCNGCWIQWNEDLEKVEEDELPEGWEEIVSWKIPADYPSIFDEDDGLGIPQKEYEEPEYLKEIREELFSETENIPLIRGILAIIYSDDKEKRELGELVYEKIKSLNSRKAMLADGTITRQFLELANSKIRELLNDDSAFVRKITEFK